MYSHNHYNHDNMSRENTNAHPLGRPASMPPLYPSSPNDNYKVVNENLMEPHHHNHNHHRSSLDGNGPYPTSTTTATGWTTHGSNSSSGNSSGWNHNHHHDNANNSIGGNGGSNGNTTSPPPPPPLSSMMDTNHGDNNTTSSSSTITKPNMDLPSIDKHYINSMTSPSNASSANLMPAYHSSNYFVSPTTTNTGKFDYLCCFV
jgi:hypothetical protein